MLTRRPIYRIVEQRLSDGGRVWFWHLEWSQRDPRDNGLIGPFLSQEEADKDARETLGINDGGIEQ
jgi:hypothetical protein